MTSARSSLASRYSFYPPSLPFFHLDSVRASHLFLDPCRQARGWLLVSIVSWFLTCTLPEWYSADSFRIHLDGQQGYLQRKHPNPLILAGFCNGNTIPATAALSRCARRCHRQPRPRVARKPSVQAAPNHNDEHHERLYLGDGPSQRPEWIVDEHL